MRNKIPVNILRSFLDTHFEVKETTDPNEVRINSIYENDSKQHLYINLRLGVFFDHKSGEKGGVAKLVAEVLELDENEVFVTLIKEYSSKEDLEKYSLVEEVKEEAKIEVPVGTKMFAETPSGIIRNRAYSYLKKRLIKEETINELGYIYDDSSEFTGRIFIPFYEENKFVYFLARDFIGSALRYKNPHKINSKEFVYNIDKIDENEVVICEGIFDALTLDKQVAFPMLSADLSKTQAIKLFAKAPRRIIYVPDNDETGERTLRKNLDILHFYKPSSISCAIGIYHLPPTIKDLNELKVKSGKDFIDFSECEEVKRNKRFVMPAFGGKGIDL
jgi:hypothetical protein